MSKRLPNTEFDLDDPVSFDHEGARLKGVIVRVYNTRDAFHVAVNENGVVVRYEVSLDDNIALERSY